MMMLLDADDLEADGVQCFYLDGESGPQEVVLMEDSDQSPSPASVLLFFSMSLAFLFHAVCGIGAT